MYIETWSQFVNKEHLIDKAVKLAVAFLEDGILENMALKLSDYRRFHLSVDT